ncbi:MAG: aldo/keto reductase [Chloroflexi bacterium]|nr:aldo/keto reductase [Chloroflexota bacterium]
MKYIQLGDRRVSAIGLGTWQFGSRGWGWGRGFGPEEARLIVRRALDLGVNFFDTAELYGGGRSEEVLREAMGERREEAFIATKVSPHHLTRRGVWQAAQRSLRRLGARRIDLYQVHVPNPLIPLSSTMQGMRDLVEAGLVQQVGVSNFGLGRWQAAERALGSAVVSNQVEYNLLAREPFDTLLPYARQASRVVVAYSPLAQGLLTGKYNQSNAPGGVRAGNSLFAPENLRRLEPLLEVLRAVARAHGAEPGQVALAWLVHDPHVIAIPGAKSVEQLEANAAAADIALSGEEWEQVRVAAQAFRPAPLITSAFDMVRRFVRP